MKPNPNDWMTDMMDLATAEVSSCEREDTGACDDDSGDDGECDDCGRRWPKYYKQPCPSCR